MDHKKYTSMNKEAWNEVQPIHQKGRKIDLKEAVKDPQFNTLAKEEMDGFTKIGYEGKEIVHVCCNNGIELLSLVKLGAKSGVGYDISDKFIAEANTYADIAQANCKYIQADAYDLNPNDHGTFDILYISVGGLCWMPDLKLFFEKCSSLLKSGGHIFIFDTHPVANMIGFDGEEGYNAKYPMNPVHSYFKEDPWIETDGIDYIGGTEYESKPMASFAYKISDILNNLIRSGVEIVEFKEYDEDIATVYGDVKDFKILPLCFSLIGKKKE